MLIIGLTGGIASGKSTVSLELRKHNIPIVDADIIAKQVVEPGQKAYAQVVEAFEKDVPDLVNDDKSLNRASLGKAVFGRKDRLAVLNRIVHGAVKKEIGWQLLKAYCGGSKTVVLDVPLLFEAGLHHICGTTVTVSTDKQTQLKRLLERNPELSEEDATKRIESQLSNEARNLKADKVIDNNGSLEQLKESVNSVVAELTPSPFWAYADYFPPFAFLSALFTVAIREWRYKQSKKQE